MIIYNNHKLEIIKYKTTDVSYFCYANIPDNL